MSHAFIFSFSFFLLFLKKKRVIENKWKIFYQPEVNLFFYFFFEFSQIRADHFFNAFIHGLHYLIDFLVLLDEFFSGVGLNFIQVALLQIYLILELGYFCVLNLEKPLEIDYLQVLPVKLIFCGDF